MLTVFLSMLAVAVVTDSTYNTKENPVEVDPIVVVGQREPVRLSKAVNSVITVPPQKMEDASEDNVLSLFNYSSSSIGITSVNGVGYGLGTYGQGRILIRGLGFTPNRGSLVLIDGRPDIAGLFGHPLPDTYQRAGLYSAELVKGGSSTLYGSNAIAGVLDLQSFYRPDLDRYTNLELKGGSYNTFDGVIQHSQKVGHAILAGWYEYLRSDNQRDYEAYFNRSGGFRAQLQQWKGMNLFLSGKVTSFDFGDAGPVYAPMPSTGKILRTGVTAGADRRTETYALSARLYNSYGHHSFSDGFHSVDRNSGIDIFGRLNHVGSKHLSLSGGLSFDQLGGNAYDGTPFTRPGNFDENEFAAHAQTEFSYKALSSLILGGRYIHHDRYGSHFVYQAGLVVTPSTIGSFKLSVGTAYRNPTINESELFMISNPDSLKPEEGTFYEVGYFKKLSASLSVETAVFWRDGKNLILTVPNPAPPPFVTFQNSGTYKHSGIEATLRFSRSRFSLNPSYTHLNQDNYNESVPTDKFVVDGGFTARRFRSGIETVAALNTRSDSAGVPVVLKDYFLVNLDQVCHITRNLDFSLKINNLFDQKYQIVSGYPMPGITFRGGLAYKMF
ncbi:MAG TPA: TonB-dependent receptor [candidate division Zixibacteria bacterium]|nr:TonB-dependent receptor [candidate division Zixibacteria bacterium]